MSISIAARKSKGRILQQLVCKGLVLAGKQFGLSEGDVLSRSISCPGTDCILSPAAIAVFGDLKIECKRMESLNVSRLYFAHAKKYPGMPNLLVHKRSNDYPLCTLPLVDCIELLRQSAELRQLKAQSADRKD